MNEPSVNPLAKHFRQAVIHLKLPSDGRYWPDGTLNLPITRELPVFPLSARDEIILKTPDALLNGSGVVQVIQSCIPSIIDAWKMPSIDVDATLIAIRIASYGNDMEINVTCPHCKTTQTFNIDLGNVLVSVPSLMFDEVFTVGDLRIKFKPQPYFEVNKSNLAKFEEQKLMDIIGDELMSDVEKAKSFSTHVNSLIDLNLTAISDSTEYIQIEDGQKVNQTEFLKEFYNECNRKMVQEIRKIYDNLVEKSKLPLIEGICENAECLKPIKVALTFDYASFFA